MGGFDQFHFDEVSERTNVEEKNQHSRSSSLT